MVKSIICKISQIIKSSIFWPVRNGQKDAIILRIIVTDDNDDDDDDGYTYNNIVLV